MAIYRFEHWNNTAIAVENIYYKYQSQYTGQDWWRDGHNHGNGTTYERNSDAMNVPRFLYYDYIPGGPVPKNSGTKGNEGPKAVPGN